MPDSDFDRGDWMLVTVALATVFFALGSGWATGCAASGSGCRE
jgi:hypothetical protein